MWKHPTPELPTPFDRFEYRAKRCKGAWWHPSLLLDTDEIATLRAALESEAGKAWLKAKGAREAALTQALLSSFLKRSQQTPRAGYDRTAHVRFEHWAKEWEESGRRTDFLIAFYELLVLQWWIGSEGGKAATISPLLREFLQESEANVPPPDYPGTLLLRQHCWSCRESYSLENLAACTHCPSFWCPNCLYFNDTPKRFNGNHACRRCPDGELVG